MRRFLICVLVLFFIAACSVTGEEMKLAQEACENHGGVKSFDVSTNEATCNDKTKITHKDLAL